MAPNDGKPSLPVAWCSARSGHKLTATFRGNSIGRGSLHFFARIDLLIIDACAREAKFCFHTFFKQSFIALHNESNPRRGVDGMNNRVC